MEANIGSLEASVGAAAATVASSEANVQRLLALQSFQKVAAPFAGIITERGIDRGALITSGSSTTNKPMFRIARVETLRVFVNVPQTFVRSVAPGQETKILVPEYPQRTFAGRIANTAGALDPTSRTLLTEVRLSNEDHALMPGMYAQVKFSVVPADSVWVIPAPALIARAAGPQVLSVRDDRTVHYLNVQLGRDLGQSIEVLSGLTGSERLVVNPPDGLKEGARVVGEERGREHS
jgi:RND family efflux transporter MFP subunit